ncbi:unnamed protein product, partial [Mesorhabditis belari]|uniref:Uncharacterized protein n=1 Tax=Mesorhabditis belari TaxID=2138241 RepID=A0AAF3ECM0_9BILA
MNRYFLFVALALTVLCCVEARIPMYKPPLNEGARWGELFDKRDVGKVGYGWSDCEFSPMSCLLRRRRSLRSFEVEMN